MAEPGLQATSIGIISTPLSIKLVKALGLTATAWLAGQTMSFSWISVPCLMTSPAPLLARQWAMLFKRGQVSGISLISLGTAIFGYLAYREPSMRTRTFSCYAASATLLPASALYTILFMLPTNHAIFQKLSEFETNNSYVPTTSDSSDANEPASFSNFVASNFTSKGPKLPEMNTHQLVDRWGWLNFGRASLFASSAVAAVWGAVNEDLSFFALF